MTIRDFNKINNKYGDLEFMEQYRYINGRRYHNVENIYYFLPNDNEEINRISSWIIDVSIDYPLSNFVGIDITNLWEADIKENSALSNVGFLEYNLLDGIPFPEKVMDFIHFRFMSLCFDKSALIKLIDEMVRVCKSNGWIEIMNFDYSLINMGPTTKLLMNSMLEFHKSKGCNVPTLKDYKKYLKQTKQITDFRIEKIITPLGNWSEKIGGGTLLGFNYLFKALKGFLAPYMKLDENQYQQLLRENDQQCVSSSQQDKRSIKQIVEEIYSIIQPTLQPLDASDRVIVAIIKALIALKNEPSNPRTLATCIQKYGFTTLGTPYATVSGHISTHFTRVRQAAISRPILGKIHHPTLKNKINYYLLDSDNVIRDLISQYFPSTSDESSQSSNNIITSIKTTPTNKTITTTKINNTNNTNNTNNINNLITTTTPTKINKINNQPISPPVSPIPLKDLITNNIYKMDISEQLLKIEDDNSVVNPFKPIIINKKRRSTENDENDRDLPISTTTYVFITNIKVDGNEFRLIRRVDTNCVDKWLLLLAGRHKPRQKAQALAAKLNLELGLFLDQRLYDYFDTDLDFPLSPGNCCGPLAGFAQWFQCVNPKK
ncbi:11705_t:CDS:2, partial [Diversispora eburnea]